MPDLEIWEMQDGKLGFGRGSYFLLWLELQRLRFRSQRLQQGNKDISSLR